MKTFEKLDDLMQHLTDVHRLSSLFFNKLRQKSADERTGMLLDDLIENEHRLEHLMADFHREAPPSVLSTYLQYSVEMPFSELLKTVVENTSRVDMENLNNVGQQLYEYQIGVIEEALREIDSEHVNDFLKDILQILDAEKHNFSKHVLSGYEI